MIDLLPGIVTLDVSLAVHRAEAEFGLYYVLSTCPGKAYNKNYLQTLDIAEKFCK